VPQRSRRTDRRPSVYDVAERAGVSIATVSRVLRGSAPVAQATRDRVLAVADELRWRPSRLARAFSEQSHGAVGIVFPDLGGPYYARLIAGFEATAADRGTAVLIAATHGRENAAELVSELADRVDGVVIAGRTVSDEVIASLERRERPVVLLARPPLGHLPAVRAANTAPALALTEHVIGHGSRRIVFVGAPDKSPDVAERWRGVRRAMRTAGIDTANALIHADGLDVLHGYKAGLDLFGTASGIEAVICANDEIASGVIGAALASGRRVPRDVVVTGWDDSPLAASLHPPLTTVHQPMHDLGARAARMLFDVIDGETARSVVLPAPVVIRGSCGCPVPPAGIRSHSPRPGGRP
jgi:LacI family transcriptional regulator